MRVVGGFEAMVGGPQRGCRRAIAVTAFGVLTLSWASAFAFDGSTPDSPAKISPKSFTSAEQALRAGIDDLKAGDAAGSVPALTSAAEGGQPIARWKLGEMYADGVGVARDDVKAYHYFNQLVEDYDEDAPDQRNRAAISNAFVAVGVYSLTGIPNSQVHADPERARELFQYAATTFGDPDAQYNLAHMYIVGAGGLAKDNITAVRWLMLAAGKGHRPSQALLGHMLFTGDGVPSQRGRGLMWLQIAKNGADGPKDEWIREVYQHDFTAANDEDRQVAAAMLDARSKGPPLPSFISRNAIKMPRPFNIPMLAATPASPPAE
ncbi:MAG TPA: tetratricopeptide repeat protein [Roseiarcus sp.]|nr:tetratricopeptide repeat protein [Roseiarcus sp.]